MYSEGVAHPHTTQHRTAHRSIALALLLLLLGTLAAPFATAQQAGHLPSCCMDAQHCSMHLHHAAAHPGDAPQLAAVAPRCPCTPLAPAAAASHGVPLLLAVGHAMALRAQSAGPARAARLPREPKGSADATRGPPAEANAPMSA